MFNLKLFVQTINDSKPLRFMIIVKLLCLFEYCFKELNNSKIQNMKNDIWSNPITLRPLLAMTPSIAMGSHHSSGGFMENHLLVNINGLINWSIYVCIFFLMLVRCYISYIVWYCLKIQNTYSNCIILYPIVRWYSTRTWYNIINWWYNDDWSCPFSDNPWEPYHRNIHQPSMGL